MTSRDIAGCWPKLVEGPSKLVYRRVKDAAWQVFNKEILCQTYCSYYQAWILAAL